MSYKHLSLIFQLIILTTFILLIFPSVRTDSVDSPIVDQNEIQSIIIVTRNGDRNAIHSYPGSPNKEYLQKLGLGDMLPSGCLRLYRSGQHISSLLPAKKERKLTFVHSVSISN